MYWNYHKSIRMWLQFCMLDWCPLNLSDLQSATFFQIYRPINDVIASCIYPISSFIVMNDKTQNRFIFLIVSSFLIHYIRVWHIRVGTIRKVLSYEFLLSHWEISGINLVLYLKVSVSRYSTLIYSLNDVMQ